MLIKLCIIFWAIPIILPIMVTDFAYYFKIYVWFNAVIAVALQTANNILLLSLKCTKSLQKYYAVQRESLAAIMFSQSMIHQLKPSKLVVTINNLLANLVIHLTSSAIVSSIHFHDLSNLSKLSSCMVLYFTKSDLSYITTQEK